MAQIIQTRSNGTRRVQTKLDPGSKVEKHHRDNCNINNIMRKYHATGQLPQFSNRAIYGDFTSATDFHDAQNRIIQAKENFLMLPSEIRGQFENDPGRMIDFLQDPENRAEAVEMGLLEALPPLRAEKPETAPEPAEEPKKKATKKANEASV